MEPRIQYTHAADGVTIAYAVAGEGPSVVYLAGWPFEHVGLEWQQPDYQLLFGHITEAHRLIRFDGRGSGLSQRDCPEFSHQSRMLDLAAVVDHLRLDRFALVGFSTSGPMAIEYAARNPERVSRLVLYDTFADAASLSGTPQMQAFEALMRANWEMFTETLSNVGYGWSAGEPARKFAAFLRACVTQETAIVAMEYLKELDVTPLLAEIRSPTLVLQHAGLPFPGIETARVGVTHPEREPGGNRRPVRELSGGGARADGRIYRCGSWWNGVA